MTRHTVASKGRREIFDREKQYAAIDVVVGSRA
jgi:hypothetical protein